MKPPNINVSLKMPMPESRTVKAAKAYVSQFAHHPPSTPKVTPRMERPRGGEGPRNPGD